jgi:hypothetical protein
MKTNLIKVCEVRARETETVAVQLAKNQYGHKVIINMIEVQTAIQIKGFFHENYVFRKASRSGILLYYHVYWYRWDQGNTGTVYYH